MELFKPYEYVALDTPIRMMYYRKSYTLQVYVFIAKQSLKYFEKSEVKYAMNLQLLYTLFSTFFCLKFNFDLKFQQKK